MGLMSDKRFWFMGPWRVVLDVDSYILSGQVLRDL